MPVPALTLPAGVPSWVAFRATSQVKDATTQANVLGRMLANANVTCAGEAERAELADMLTRVIAQAEIALAELARQH